MNTNTKKRGRPKGETTVGLYRRLKPAWARMASLLISAMDSCPEDELEEITNEVIRLIQCKEKAVESDWAMRIPPKVVRGGPEPEKPAVSYKDDPYNGIPPDNAFKGLGESLGKFEDAATKVMKEREVLMLRLALSERDDRIKELEGKAVIPVVVETEEVLFLRAELAKYKNRVKELEDQGKWGA